MRQSLRSASCTLNCVHRRIFGVCSGDSYLAATPKVLGAERPQPQATFGKQTKAIVVTTGMLAFISFWRASAVVLCDLASSAYYIGGIVETGLRPLGAILHSRRYAVLVRCARRVRRIVLDVHARRRLSRRQRSDGLDAGENLGLGPDVRLHPDRPYQRRFGRPIPGRPDQRTAQARVIRASYCRPISRPPSSPSPSRFISGAKIFSASRSPAARRCASCRSRPSWP